MLFAAMVLVEVVVLAVSVLLRVQVDLLLLVVASGMILASLGISRRRCRLLTAVDPTAESAACRKR